MNPVLFADADWFQLLVVVFVFFGWVIKHVIQGVKDEPAKRAVKPAQRRPQPRPGVGADRAEKPQELEQFLEDLGIRKREHGQQTPPRPQALPANQRRKPKPMPRPAQRPKPQPQPQDVSKRHLRSRLENRRPEEMHSALEDQHLQSSMKDDLKVVRITDSTPANVVKKDIVLLDMVRQKDQLVRTFIVGEVLGKPLSLR